MSFPLRCHRLTQGSTQGSAQRQRLGPLWRPSGCSFQPFDAGSGVPSLKEKQSDWSQLPRQKRVASSTGLMERKVLEEECVGFESHNYRQFLEEATRIDWFR